MKFRTARSLLTCAWLAALAACGGGSDGGDGGGSDAVVVMLPHMSLVYDAQREVYYASVASSDPTRGNHIATIDRRGNITATTAPVGSSPGALALSKDGSRLYVALDGSSEVLQFAMPGFTRLASVALPADSSFGPMVAEQLTVSPVDANTFAVSLARPPNVSPRHGGVALVKNMVILPTRTSDHTGANRIAFEATGTWLQGFNNETTEFGARTIQPQADGLRETLVMALPAANFDWDIDSFGTLVMVGNRALSVGTLAPRGTVAGASFHCVGVASGTKVACFSVDYGKLVVANTTNFNRIGEASFPETSSTAAFRLVPGPAGQVAASAQVSGRIYLINSDLLR